MISIKETAVLDDNQKAIIARIAVVCGDNGLAVTRGHATPQEQLTLIARFARDNDCLFPEFLPKGPIDLKKELAGIGLVYHWQRTWSKLLHIGVVVNPPLPAICLEEYTRPSGEAMKGKTIDGSAHVFGQKNGCFPIDFSARANGTVNYALVRDILEQAQRKDAGIKEIKIERGNTCVHIDTLPIKED